MTPLFSDVAFMRRWAIRLGIAWLALFYFRAGWVSREEYELGAVAYVAHDERVAIAHFRRSVKHHAPLVDRGADALESLASIATTAESRGDHATALAAWRSARAAILASRWLLVPHRDVLEHANRRIAHLVARHDEGAARSDAGVATRERRALDALAAEPHENGVGVLLALVGLIAFLASAHGLVSRAVTLDDQVDREAATRFVTTFVVGVAIFVIGLWVT